MDFMRNKVRASQISVKHFKMRGYLFNPHVVFNPICDVTSKWKLFSHLLVLNAGQLLYTDIYNMWLYH